MRKTRYLDKYLYSQIFKVRNIYSHKYSSAQISIVANIVNNKDFESQMSNKLVGEFDNRVQRLIKELGEY